MQAPNGVVAESPWEAENITLPYKRLGFGDRWLLVTGRERDLIEKLSRTGRRLDDTRLTQNIFVGIQTSADYIYHMKRLGPNRYEERPPKGQERGRVVRIEDAIMKPLVSGQEAKRYLTPRTDIYLLFPYRVAEGRQALISASKMQSDYPLAWAYLCDHEEELRGRESRKMDVHDRWWAYNYPKNLDKQDVRKLIVPRLVASLGCSVDGERRVFPR